MIQIKKLQNLGWGERGFLLQAFFWLPVTFVLLQLHGFQRTKKLFSQGKCNGERSAVGPADIDFARRLAHLIDIASNHGVYRARCLQKSLVLTRFLRRKGIPCELHLGSRLQGREFGAHAWVSCGNEVVNDRHDIDRQFTDFSISPKRSVLPE